HTFDHGLGSFIQALAGGGPVKSRGSTAHKHVLYEILYPIPGGFMPSPIISIHLHVVYRTYRVYLFQPFDLLYTIVPVGVRRLMVVLRYVHKGKNIRIVKGFGMKGMAEIVGVPHFRGIDFFTHSLCLLLDVPGPIFSPV